MISHQDLPRTAFKAKDLTLFRRSVRRALIELGPSDSKLNMMMAEKLLSFSTDQFVKKWNFDPVSMTPLTGRYEWSPARDAAPSVADSNSRLQDIQDVPGAAKETRDQSPVMSSCSDLVRRTSSGKPRAPVKWELRSPVRRKAVIKSRSMNPRKRQKKITDYCHQRKRRYSPSKSTVSPGLAPDSPKPKLQMDESAPLMVTSFQGH